MVKIITSEPEKETEYTITVTDNPNNTILYVDLSDRPTPTNVAVY